MLNRKPGKRVVLLGNSGVGKTRMLNHLLSKPDIQTKPTRGADYHYKDLVLGDEQLCLEVIDITGEAQFNMLLAGYLIGTDYVWFVCDTKDADSLYAINNQWFDLVNRYAQNSAKALLIWQDDEKKSDLAIQDIQRIAINSDIVEHNCFQVSISDHQNISLLYNRFYQNLPPEKNKITTGSKFSQAQKESLSATFIDHPARKLLIAGWIAAGIAVAAYFIWPVMLTVAAGLFVGAVPWMLVAGLATVTATVGLLLSGLSAFAIDKSISSCVSQSYSTSQIMSAIQKNDELPKVRCIRGDGLMQDSSFLDDDDRSSTEEDKEEFIRNLLIEEYPLIDDNAKKNYRSF